MPPIAKEPEAQNSSQAASPNSTQRVQPVALEIAVTVNGARSVDGTDKREPFSETTQTVLVFGNGAVIRLSSSVAPGQLLFLTNEKTKKEVVCQVVKSKNYRSVSGYVELEFTEPAVGFWGMRFPTDRIGTGPAAPSATPAAAVPAKSAPVAASSEASSVLPASPISVAPPIAVVPPPVPAIPVPASAAPVNAAPPAPPADSASNELKKQAARLQEQLSSMLFSETPAPAQSAPAPSVPPAVISEASTKILEMTKAEPPAAQVKHDPAPATKTFEPLNLSPVAPKPTASLHDEAVKIPSWLEPLARNAAAPTQPAAQQSAAQPINSHPEPVASLTDNLDAQVAGESYDFGSKLEAVAAPAESAEAQVPNFGSDLFANSDTSAVEPAERGSKKGIWIGAIAATVLLAAGGGYWYTQQSGHAAASTTSAAVSQPLSQPALQTQSQSFVPASTQQSTKTYSTPSQSNSQPLNSAGASVTPATEVQKIPASHEFSKPPVSSASSHESEPAEDARKANFSGIRLAAPTVKGGSSQTISNVSEPGLALDNSAAAPGGPVSGGLVGSHGNQPAIPIPIGGEVKPAALIASVPPIYPALARSQRISGDVKIDALIDERGHVTGMKIVSGPVMLYQAAQDALRQWKYRPATLNGEAVSMHLVVTIQFKLQ
jgi:TonB family protein